LSRSSTLKPSEREQVFAEIARVIQQKLPRLARRETPGKQPSDPATQLAPLVDEIAARVVQLLGSDRKLQPRASGKSAANPVLSKSKS
jgi:hypothetical protein